MQTVTPTSLSGKHHLPALDGFRGLSILAVLAAHMLPLGPGYLGLNGMAGLMGMSMFFCLSGFLITSFLLSRPDVPTFLIRRGARIVPLVLLVTTFYCLIFQYRPDSFVAANLYYLNYADSAFAQGIGPLWSLSLEMQFYIAIAFGFLTMGRRALWLVAVAAIVVTGLRIEGGIVSNIRTHLRADEILAGALLAILWWHRGAPRAALVLRMFRRLFWPIFFLWLLSCHAATWPVPILRPYLTAALVGSVLMMESGWQNALLSNRYLIYIATISYALYVWHSPFRSGWFAEGSTMEVYMFRRPIGISMTFILAHLSTFYFEKPITNVARRLTSAGSPVRTRSGATGRGV